MDADIGPLLDKWPYDEEVNTRRITGHDGRDKLQVRLPLGVEQYEVDGRPDGVKPEGFESYLDYYCAVAEREGRDWQLSTKAFGDLHEEGLLYYFRYLLSFAWGSTICASGTPNATSVSRILWSSIPAATIWRRPSSSTGPT